MEKMDIPTVNHHVGSTERVFLAHINDLNDFYLHSELVHDSLIKLGGELYEKYSESLTKPLGINETLNVGDYCACPSESEDWYRGIIRQLESNGLATVFKIDYGDVLYINIQFLRPLQKRFFQLHRLAFHCSLVNLIKPLNGWPLEVIDEFRSRLTTTFLYARFINHNEVRDISEVEITEKTSKTPLNKDFEQYQMERSLLQINDKFIYKYIPMEMLDSNQPNQIRMLYYISPNRFYVYLRDKLNSHSSFQMDLQKATQNLRPISSPLKYQLIAVQDNHAIWHRATILDCNPDLTKVRVFFLDIGLIEIILINNIRPLPEEFQRKPTFAIPCRLFNVCPINGNEQSIWKSNDQIHDELNRLMVNNVSCEVRAKQNQICYDIQIDIPKVGDLGTFLFDKSLVSRPTMQNSQRSNFSSGPPPQQQSFVRTQLSSLISPQRQHQQTRMLNPGLQNTIIQQTSNMMPPSSSSLTISAIPPQDGNYTIIRVHSAVEFYGLSQHRERELDSLSKYIEDYYNNSVNDQSLNMTFFLDGTPCVIQQDDRKYHRVIIKHREGESRVLVKLVDRGDEIIVDTSELLQIDSKCCTIPAFAQPFRLRGYDESQSTVNTTRSLKKLILNQRVHIAQQGPGINGFHPVEVTLSNNQSVNQMLLSNDKNVTSPISNNRPTFNQPQHTHIESRVYSNSTKHHSSINQDSSARFAMGHRTNDVLPAPQKILTGPPRTQPGRFGVTNQSGSALPSTNEQPSRFSNLGNRNQQPLSQPMASTSSNLGWNKDQSNKPSFGGGSGVVNQQPFGRQQSLGSSQFGMNQRTDDNKTSSTNNQTRFPSTNYENQQPSFEQKRPFGSSYTYDDRNEKQPSANTFQQYNDGTNDGGFRRGGFSNRGNSGFNDRGGRGGFGDRNMTRNNDDNSNENSPQSPGGFAKRGGGFNDRGGRGRSFQDRNGANRNQGDDFNDNSMPRSNNFNNSRGGFQNRRDQGENGNFGRRGGRGDHRGGGFGGIRGGIRDRDEMNLQLSSDKNNSTNTFGTWSNPRPTSVNFEAGDRFVDNEVPKDAFKFVISHIETANSFFIQLLSKADELTKLTETLQADYKQSPETNLSTYKTNQACLAKSSDNCWYRAIVLSTGLTKLKIRFIDFGDTTDVSTNTIRQLAKKHCAASPYAYQCTFKNAQVADNVSTTVVINACAGKEFIGKTKSKTSDGKFILESDDFVKVLLEINAIKLKSEVELKRIKCFIAHIEPEEQRFYIHDDRDTVEKIADLIESEEPTAPNLSLDEVKQLDPNAMVIATFDEEPFRAIIQSDESDENINVCYVDYGNTSSCSKTSLKRCSEQLSSYPPQAKHCELYGISSGENDNAYKYLQDNSDSETVEIAIVNEKDRVYKVLVYIDDQCINGKYGYDPNLTENNDTSAEIDDESSTTTATTVKEQEQSSSTAEKQTNDDVLLANENSSDVSGIIKSETEETSSKYHQGLLTHIEKHKPYVYLQLIPESEPIIDQINELIATITGENKHNSTYNIGDHVVAQFSEDDSYYRARIESYSSSSELYTVYFLDYGNVDENVPVDHLYSYSDDLEKIEPQARGYLLDETNAETWDDVGRAVVEKQIYAVIDFCFSDETNSTIHVKFDLEDEIVEQTKTFVANLSATDNDCFYIHVLPDGNLHVCEIEEVLQICAKDRKDTWSINDLCIVSNEHDQYYRGQILAIDDDGYDVKCIDYGNVLKNITDDRFYVVPDEEIFKRPPLAHQCRLHEIDDINQVKAIEEVIQYIQTTERVTITVENDEDDECWFVILVKENGDNVNERYLLADNDMTENEYKQESDNDEKDDIIAPNSPDSAITADVDTVNNDEQLPTPTDVPQEAGTTINVPENNSLSSTSNNQTIDFGENDPSTTIKDETNNSLTSN